MEQTSKLSATFEVKSYLRKLDAPAVLLIIALLVGLALRISGWMHGLPDLNLERSTDAQMYDAMARNLIAGKGYAGTSHMIARVNEPTAFYGPTYPFYLVALYALFGVNHGIVYISHIILSMLTVYLIYVLGTKVYSRMAGAIAAALFAVSPHIIDYGFKLLSETLYIFLEVALLILVVTIIQKERPSWKLFGAAGLLFGIAYLCRQTIFIAPLLFVPIIWLALRKNGYAWLVKSTAVFAVATVLVVTPWVVRNYVAFHEVMLGTTTGPATLWWGSLEEKGTPLTTLITGYKATHTNLSEIGMSHAMSKEARYNIMHYTKSDIAQLLYQRPRRLFGYPKRIGLHSRQTRVGIIYNLLSIAGLIGLFMTISRRYDRLLVGLFVVATLSLHLLTLTVFRYLMPMVPLLAIGIGQLALYVTQRAMEKSRVRAVV